ncbi:OmpA/MotB family protein [Clostridium ihumii]|uniref:OmpA/MotB family protein n=1 Tax=Clostridium ihumii TaxID=1470356 RepID=UPI00058C8C5A|nr:OmpA family protein [Clostridium ihumii]
MRKKKKGKKKESGERWLLTYSDLITLLMIFFVIMYSSSSINAQKYKAMSNSFQSVFGGGTNVIGEGGNGSGNSDVDEKNQEPNVINTELVESKKLENIKSEVDNLINESDLKEHITTSIEDKGLIISFKDSMFFESGKADITDSMKEQLDKVSKLLNKMNNYIRVEGHTDNIPIKNNDFSSNWKLSVLRASNVVEYLIDSNKISPDRISAVGYGEYRPISSNEGESGRSKNRRVDIVILNSKFENTENNSK